MKRIVVGYDGSESARRALDRVSVLCGNDTEVEVVGAVHVLPPGKGSVTAIDPIEAELRESTICRKLLRCWQTEESRRARSRLTATRRTAS